MLDESEQRVIDDIARVGWHLIGVEADEEGPGFVYSIGMMPTLNHPEVIMFGLRTELMVSVINGMGDAIRGGRPFCEPVLYEGLLEGYACKIIPVHESQHPEYLGYAMWHRRYLGRIDDLQAVQCVWPDKAGLFPDEPGCHPYVVTVQPMLNVPRC